MIGLLKTPGILNKRTWILSVFYFVIGIFYILLPVIPSSIPHLAVKALIIPILIGLFRAFVKNGTVMSHWLMTAALIFSWAGDVALGITTHPEAMFMLGLICFLLTHIFYFIVFFLTPGKNLSFKKFLSSLIPLLIYGLFLLYILYDELGGMRIPVMLYTFFILAMVAGAINRVEKVNRTSYYLVLTGALLFLSSDSILAINKFSHPFALASPLIMFTYITGQYLIVMGYIFGTKAYGLSSEPE
jgi:uncharacterized membrane protein YhhN